MATNNEINLKIIIDSKNANNELNNIDENVKSITNHFEKLNNVVDKEVNHIAKRLENVRNVIQGAREGFQLFSEVFNEPLQLAIQKEGFETTLKVMLGSVEAAKERMAEYTQFATITPFQLNQVVDLGNKLTAMGRYSIQLMTDLGDLAAASGKPIEQVVGAFSKLSTGQIGAAKDMFRDLLINDNDWAQMLNEKGLTMTAENMISVLHDIMVKKGFSGMMGEMSKTTAGAISNMEDSFSKMKTVFGGMIATGIRPFIDSITQATGMLYEFSPALAGALVGITSIGGALLFANMTGIMPFIFKIETMKIALTTARVQFALASMSGQTFAGAMHSAGLAVKGFFASLGPIGWAIMGITALTLAMQFLNSESEETNVQLSEQEKKLMKEQQEIKNIQKAILDENTPREKKKQLFDELNSKYPALLNNIDIEKTKTEDLKKVFEALNQEYERKIKMAAKERKLGDITEQSIQIEMELQEAEKLLEKTEKTGRRWDDLAQMWIEGDNELYLRRLERVNELKRKKEELQNKYNEIMLEDKSQEGGAKPETKKTLDWYANEIKKLEEIQKQFDKVGALTNEAKANKQKLAQLKKEEEELRKLLFGEKEKQKKDNKTKEDLIKEELEKLKALSDLGIKTKLEYQNRLLKYQDDYDKILKDKQEKAKKEEVNLATYIKKELEDINKEKNKNILEQLESYYNAGLISEQEYLDSILKIYNESYLVLLQKKQEATDEEIKLYEKAKQKYLEVQDEKKKKEREARDFYLNIVETQTEREKRIKEEQLKKLDELRKQNLISEEEYSKAVKKLKEDENIALQQAYKIGSDSIKAGLNSLWQDNVIVSRETKNTWDKAWLSIENTALNAIGNILIQELEALAISALAHDTTEKTKTASTIEGSTARQTTLLGEILTTLTSAAANVLNAIAIAISSLVEFLGPLGFLAMPLAVASIIGVYQGAKAILGFAEGGLLPKGKTGFIEGYYNEIIAPEKTFIDVMNSNIIPQLNLTANNNQNENFMARFERAIDRFENKQFKLRGIDLVTSQERIAINSI